MHCLTLQQFGIRKECKVNSVIMSSPLVKVIVLELQPLVENKHLSRTILLLTLKSSIYYVLFEELSNFNVMGCWFDFNKFK